MEEAAELRDEALERRLQARQALDTALAGEGGVASDQEPPPSSRRCARVATTLVLAK